VGDNGFHTWFRDFAKDTFLEVFGGGQQDSSGQVNSTPAGSAGNAKLELPACRHQWLRPDHGVIECATCGATRIDYEHIP
jgi:hypothetical protein